MEESSGAWLTAIVGAIGCVVGALIQTFGRDLFDFWKNPNYTVPNLDKHWKAEWYMDNVDGNPIDERLYIEDRIEISSQRGTRFKAHGIDALNRPVGGKYPMAGKFNTYGVITFTYDFKDPNCPLVGGGVMRPDTLSKKIEGRWHGFVQEGKLVCGRVVWRSESASSMHGQHSAQLAPTPTSTANGTSS